MSNDAIILTREALYEKVWSEPISKIAASYHLSDRGLGKVCARHDIPVPPRGWWAKKQHGHRVRQQPLPASRHSNVENIVFHPSRAEGQTTDVEAPELLRERAPEWRIAVPDDLQISHP